MKADFLRSRCKLYLIVLLASSILNPSFPDDFNKLFSLINVNTYKHKQIQTLEAFVVGAET